MLLAFWKLCPLTLALTVCGLAITLIGSYVRWLGQLRSNLRNSRAAVVLSWLTVGNIAIYMLVPHWLNLRYASVSFAPLCLFAGVGFCQLFPLLKRKLSGRVFGLVLASTTAAVLISAAADYQRFQTAWMHPRALDLAVKVVFLVMDR